MRLIRLSIFVEHRAAEVYQTVDRLKELTNAICDGLAKGVHPLQVLFVQLTDAFHAFTHSVVFCIRSPSGLHVGWTSNLMGVITTNFCLQYTTLPTRSAATPLTARLAKAEFRCIEPLCKVVGCSLKSQPKTGCLIVSGSICVNTTDYPTVCLEFLIGISM